MQSKEISFRVPGWMHRQMIEMYTRLLREAVEAGWSGGSAEAPSTASSCYSAYGRSRGRAIKSSTSSCVRRACDDVL